MCKFVPKRTVIARDGTEMSADHSIVTHYLAQLNQMTHGVTLTSQVSQQKYKQYAMQFGQSAVKTAYQTAMDASRNIEG